MADLQLLVVRHPETEANVNGRFVGRGNVPFTAVGREQVRRVVGEIEAFRPDAVWSSPLERTHVPAALAADLLGIPHRIDDRLIELDFGAAEGMTIEEIEAAGLTFEYRSRDIPVAPGGESRGDIERRSAAVVDELACGGGRHAIVTHGGPMRAMLVHTLGLASSDIWAFHLRNAQLAFITVAEDGHGWLEEFRQA